MNSMKLFRITDVMRRKVRHIHFVGIGGIGMSGIAEVLLNLGYTVSGSDLRTSDTTEHLSSLGATVFQGHKASNLTDVDVVVTSTAVRKDNPEVLEAHRRSVPVIPRAEMLAELLKMKVSIAVSGSHGKTTTTSMIATVMASGGLDPTMVIGGKLGSIGSNARMGHGEFIVAEADESDGSFLKLSPSLAVITNIDREHLDFYRGIEDIKDAFLQFANIVPFYGSAVLCLDDPHIKTILSDIKRKTITYGMEPAADYRAQELRFNGAVTEYELYYRTECLGSVTLSVPGMFNVYNSLATVAVARELDMTFPDIQQGLKSYVGVGRRLEVKGKITGVTVVDDYGHHPTEISATLAAARQVWKNRMIVVFQPHRYTRTQALFREFLGAFTEADLLIVTDIYPASEDPIEGVTAEALCDGIRSLTRREVRYIPNFSDITDYLMTVVQPGDTVITQGAGSVNSVGVSLLSRLKEVEDSRAA
ncbi:MAG: UDP-N-acetylmuramate--L-alanine ligase [Syntrophus sp. PtaB.Bin075]|nr:MAG: UDP-N-acetylmuramate--L-alanine ligase [Syntrophus sp. PtaB.Bin075]